MRVAGSLLSGLGHAGVLALAAIGPPFLWAPPDRPVPAMSVTLLTGAELAAMMPPPPAPPAPPPPAPAVTPAPMPPPLVPEAPEETPPPAATTLAPDFDSGAPLGMDEGLAVQAGVPDLSQPAESAPEEAADAVAIHAEYLERVQRAVIRARVYPEVARARGLEGRVAFQLVLAPDGRLLASQLLRSSGAMTLDRAALETVRRAAYPPAPATIAVPRLPVAVEVVFTGSDR
jgi:periplasmic protein TonB